MEQIQQQGQAAGKGKKILLITFGVLATGAAGFFGYEFWKKRKQKKEDQQSSDTSLPAPFFIPPAKTDFTPPNPTPTSTAGQSADFPLVKGSKGAKVKQMQEALIMKNGKKILPRYGADGDFGKETSAALAKLGFPAIIDEATFNTIVGIKVWPFSGLGRPHIITAKITVVWPNPKTAITVPPNMVLGQEVEERGEHTLFENNGQHFLVKTDTIKHL
jgi:hypothetical protein